MFVSAIGLLAWTSAASDIAAGLWCQTPAASVTSALTQQTGTPTAPVPSSAGAYLTTTPQPAATTMAPRPPRCPREVIPPGLSRPRLTRHPWRTPPISLIPIRCGRGVEWSRWARPSIRTLRSGVHDLWHADTDLHHDAWPDFYQQPVRRPFGFFQRWRQQAMPAYGTATYGTPAYYGTPVYSTTGYAAPAYTTYGYSTPTYYTRRTHRRWPRSPRPVCRPPA